MYHSLIGPKGSYDFSFVRSLVRPSVCSSVFRGLAYCYFRLIFCMELGSNKHIKLTNLMYSGKFLICLKWGKWIIFGPKIYLVLQAGCIVTSYKLKFWNFSLRYFFHLSFFSSFLCLKFRVTITTIGYIFPSRRKSHYKNQIKSEPITN